MLKPHSTWQGQVHSCSLTLAKSPRRSSLYATAGKCFCHVCIIRLTIRDLTTSIFSSVLGEGSHDCMIALKAWKGL